MKLNQFTIETPVGSFSVICVQKQPGKIVVCAAGFADCQKLQARLPVAWQNIAVTTVQRHPYKTKFQAYFKGQKHALKGIRWEQAGTEFSRAVWAQITRVKVGEVITYGELAAAIGRPRAVRAVGTACGRNLVAVLVPCHRVVSRTGSGDKYVYGAAAKAFLLALEH